MIVDRLLSLISKAPRATEQELSDEIHRVQGVYDSLRRVHDSTNLAVQQLEAKNKSQENTIQRLQQTAKARSMQDANMGNVIQSLAQNTKSEPTKR